MSSKVFTERLWEVDDLSKDELQKVVFALLDYMELQAIRTNDTKHGETKISVKPERGGDES